MSSYKALTFVLLLFLVSKTTAQPEAHTHFFDPQSKLTWLGLDFSEARLVGTPEQYYGKNMAGLIAGWNELMLKEISKYNVAKMLHRKTIDIDLNVTIKHNAGINLDNIMTNVMKFTRHLDPDSIATIVASYDFGGLSGNGVMINVEAFSEYEEMALVWVTFVDMDSKKVLFTRRLRGEAGGAGVRNYYANAIFEVIEQVKKTYYTQWSKRK